MPRHKQSNCAPTGNVQAAMLEEMWHTVRMCPKLRGARARSWASKPPRSCVQNCGSEQALARQASVRHSVYFEHNEADTSGLGCWRGSAVLIRTPRVRAACSPPGYPLRAALRNTAATSRCNSCGRSRCAHCRHHDTLLGTPAPGPVCASVPWPAAATLLVDRSVKFIGLGKCCPTVNLVATRMKRRLESWNARDLSAL